MIWILFKVLTIKELLKPLIKIEHGVFFQERAVEVIENLLGNLRCYFCLIRLVFQPEFQELEAGPDKLAAFIVIVKLISTLE